PATDQPTFAAGAPVIGQLTKRLGSVSVLIVPPQGGAPVAVKNYALSYQNPNNASSSVSARTGRSLLRSVQVSSGDGTLSLPAAKFTWSEAASGFANAVEVSNRTGTGLTSDNWYQATTY